jgi:uncharacterized cupredoxin-like copper-binding protein
VPRPRPPVVLLAASMMLLAACSNTKQVVRSGTLQVALTEYRVQPQSVRTPTGTLTIVVHNDGRLSHQLVISLDGHPEASTKPIPPGQSAELFATLIPGKYQMSSPILSDQALGAYGTLTVTK